MIQKGGAKTAGTKHTFKASEEVICSAGAVHSPAILNRSGIGRKADLEKVAIECLHDLPQVGYNLQDHIYCALAYAPSIKGTVRALCKH